MPRPCCFGLNGNSGKIEIGDNATITGNADTDYQSNLIQVMSENGVIEIGDDMLR